MSENVLKAYIDSKTEKKKPKMSVQERIALNEAAPEDVELKTRDKIYKGVKTGGAKVADTILGTMVGDAVASVGKNIIKGNAARTSAKIMGDKGVRALKDIDEGMSKLSKSDFRDMLELAQSLGGTKEQVDAIEQCIKDPSLFPALKDKIGPMVNFFAYHNGLPTIADPSDRINRDTMTKFAKAEKVIDKTGIPIGGILGFITAPFESFSKAQDKKLSRKAKEKVLWKLFATPGQNNDFRLADSLSRMEDDELDSLIQMNMREIKSMYSE